MVDSKIENTQKTHAKNHLSLKLKVLKLFVNQSQEKSWIVVYNKTQKVHTTFSTQTVALQVDGNSKNLNLSFESENEFHSTFDDFKLQQNLDRNYDANNDSCLIVF